MEKSELNSNQHTGRQGEELASSFLEERGYLKLHQNWRYARCEVDIIASKDKTLHFVEVKTRTGKGFGTPELKVNKAKIKQLKLAAEGYLFQNPSWKFIQFDIVAITLEPGEEPDIFLIEDIF